MKAAYYSRAGSYSRSYNAEVAEEEGRLPLTRAAASLGLSVAAFQVGCRAAGYVATEWHHVAKFANRVDYYDCPALALNPQFWAGAAAAYKTAARRAAVLSQIEFYRVQAAAAAQAEEAEYERQHAEMLAWRRRRLRAQWLAPIGKPAHRHHGAGWVEFCRAAFAAAGCPYAANQTPSTGKTGDRAALAERIAARLEKLAAKASEPVLTVIACRAGTCLRCGQPIAAGDQIRYQPGTGAWHADCEEVQQ